MSVANASVTWIMTSLLGNAKTPALCRRFCFCVLLGADKAAIWLARKQHRTVTAIHR